MTEQAMTAARLRNFFSRARMTHNCPFCGESGWMFAENVSGAIYTDAKEGMFGSDIYLLVCQSCGFIRSHAKEQLLKAVLDFERSEGDVQNGG